MSRPTFLQGRSACSRKKEITRNIIDYLFPPNFFSYYLFMLKGADKLQDFYLLFFPVNEVPVICEDSSASLPELQEDRC